jgi:phospholipase/carboxylesterase
MSLVTNVVRPAGEADRLLLMVHGLGADEHDLTALLPHLDRRGRLLAVFPRAPHTLPFGGYGWFDFGGPDGVDRSSFLSALDALDDALDSACAEHGLAREQSVVGGFSQGCALTLALAYRSGAKPRPAAVLAMSGLMVHAPWLPYEESDDLPPALVQHGTYDGVLPVARGWAAARDLTVLGAPVVYREYPIEHHVSIESVDDAGAWLDAVLAGERPEDPGP